MPVFTRRFATNPEPSDAERLAELVNVLDKLGIKLPSTATPETLLRDLLTAATAIAGSQGICLDGDAAADVEEASGTYMSTFRRIQKTRAPLCRGIAEIQARSSGLRSPGKMKAK